MEGGVEHSHHGNVAEHLAGGLDTQNTGGIVQRSQRAQLTQRVDDLIGDQAAALELLAAMHDAVTDGVDLAHVIDALACTGGHLLHDLGKSLGVGGEDRRGGSLGAVGLVSDHAALHANALAQAFAQHLLAVHIDQLILQGRRTAVNNQNLHLCCLLKIFVPSAA